MHFCWNFPNRAAFVYASSSAPNRIRIMDCMKTTKMTKSRSACYLLYMLSAQNGALIRSSRVALEVEASAVECSNCALGQKLRELETLGIQENESSVYDLFIMQF